MLSTRSRWQVPALLAAMILAGEGVGPMTASAAVVDPVSSTIRVMSRRFGQNRIELERLFGGYLKVKTLAPPSPEIEARIAPLEERLYESYAAGKKDEGRQALHHAFVLLKGGEWTPREDVAHSLVLYADEAVTDPDGPLIGRLEQLYRPAGKLESPLRLQVRLLNAKTPLKSPPVKELGTFETASTALIDQPLSFDLDVHDVAEGPYALGVEVSVDDEPLRRISTPVFLMRGLEEAREEMEQGLEGVSGHDSAKATIRYPFDFALRVNQGLREPRIYDFRDGVRRSRELLASLEEGDDPLAGAVGDQTRHYAFDEAGEIMPYRIYVPTRYDGKSPFPLIMALHGGGGDENTMIGGHDSLMKELAEERGYIVAAPLGYRPYGGYGKALDAKQNPDLLRQTRLSELDVMNVLAEVCAEYNIDERRICLMGHSMGGNGTWRLGAKYAENWAALAPISSGQATPKGFSTGRVSPNLTEIVTPPYDFEAIRHLPVLVCHGVLDPRAQIENARAMVAGMKELDMTHEYFEKPDGTHAMVRVSLPRVFDFFDRHAGGQGSESTSDAAPAQQEDAEGEPTADDFEPRRFTASDGAAMSYRLFIPKDYDPERSYPLVLHLHGGQKRGNDNRRQATLPGARGWLREEIQAENPCFVVAPQCPKDAYWGRQDMPEEFVAQMLLPAVFELLDALEKEFNIDKAREYVMGHSMGGAGTWAAITMQPRRFAAAVPSAGHNDPERASEIVHTPVWVFHGAKDDKIDVENSRAIVKALREAGGDPKYTEIPDLGHDSQRAVFVETEGLADWLFGQRRSE
jgi:predicted peptidase